MNLTPSALGAAPLLCPQIPTSWHMETKDVMYAANKSSDWLKCHLGQELQSDWVQLHFGQKLFILVLMPL